MTMTRISTTAALLAAALLTARPALAGPPLLCFPFNIGHARTMDLGVELPQRELQAVCSHEHWAEVYERLVQLIEKKIKPHDIINRKSLENAYTLVLALGGSTNAVLHLMAIANEAEVEWTLADFDRLGAKVLLPWQLIVMAISVTMAMALASGLLALRSLRQVEPVTLLR